MSPRAACRLEQLGFTDVYDYVPGKADWLAAGLPREGEAAAIPFPGDIASSVPTCHYLERLDAVLERLGTTGDSFCAVVTHGKLVLGMLYVEEARRGTGTVAEAMRPGPTTVRASEPLSPLVERMRKAGVDGILVTDPEGRLLGLMDRRRAEQVLSSRP
jgi:predicted transcriptional regulator